MSLNKEVKRVAEQKLYLIHQLGVVRAKLQEVEEEEARLKVLVAYPSKRPKVLLLC
jgi:hypothetical protein